jgi:hypothetical protein
VSPAFQGLPIKCARELWNDHDRYDRKQRHIPYHAHDREHQDRSREFYHNVLGAEFVRNRDPVIRRFHYSVIVLNVGGGPTGDKPMVTMAPPLT